MTKDEILFIAIIVLIFVVGAAAKHYRNHHPHLPVVTPSIPGQSRPSARRLPRKNLLELALWRPGIARDPTLFTSGNQRIGPTARKP